jgi:hypothetical protein
MAFPLYVEPADLDAVDDDAIVSRYTQLAPVVRTVDDVRWAEVEFEVVAGLVNVVTADWRAAV